MAQKDSPKNAPMDGDSNIGFMIEGGQDWFVDDQPDYKEASKYPPSYFTKSWQHPTYFKSTENRVGELTQVSWMDQAPSFHLFPFKKATKFETGIAFFWLAWFAAWILFKFIRFRQMVKKESSPL